MKKALIIFLVAIMSLTFVACSEKDSSTDKDTPIITKDSYIGTWQRVFYSKEEEKIITQIIEIYKGGTGHFRSFSDKEGSFDYNYTATWEITDGVLNLSYVFVTVGFELDVSVEPNTLTRVDDSSAVFIKIK